MMDFITIPLVVGMITLGIYKLFELFVRKRERLIMIEKMSDKLNPPMLEEQTMFAPKFFNNISFGSLKIGCLLIGVGLGLLIGFFITMYAFGSYNLLSVSFMPGDMDWNRINQVKEMSGIVYGASVFIFGGLGLLTAFLLEMRYTAKNKKN
ncbi:DUF6249 domain-containing protein [Microbacter margulisiae]|uniref:DUF6249 domain-containing protein n=1 Tax=Microbacter margulisiae TaxID=1350067 RepID=A0A7W5H2I0_9PORP|nr:DUF6249 domain-containing protein [Microbacter margulisiae]MBB3187639.1 hypothetical protein [Microbacter margulisiae]